jgi:hypothetical protein
MADPKMNSAAFPAFLFLLVLGTLPRACNGSYAFYVGKNLTQDGSVLVGGTGEEVSSHWLQLFPALDHLPNETISVRLEPFSIWL